MPRKVPKPLMNKNRATENRKNYPRARDASRSRSRSGVRKNTAQRLGLHVMPMISMKLKGRGYDRPMH